MREVSKTNFWQAKKHLSLPIIQKAIKGRF